MRRTRDWQALANIRSSEITDQTIYRQRRQIIKASLAAGLGGTIMTPAARAAPGDAPLAGPIEPSSFSTDEDQTTFDTATSYNNFYELGLDKEDPKRNADQLVTDPWSVTVEGECSKPGTLTIEDVLKPHAIEERIYRLRCVEAWSMVVPWNGFALGDLLKRFEPTGNARFVAFETVSDQDLPGLGSPVLDWPYQEGLRMDEAMHPLTMIAIGMYGETLPNQNGAPLRLVVPWKYGFKSIKSIVRIRFTEEQPATSWNQSAPHEYGFYSNVNPDVSHPRWSQARERRLAGDSGPLAALFQSKIDTRMMNGYADEVGSLYSDMDLERYF